MNINSGILTQRKEWSHDVKRENLGQFEVTKGTSERLKCFSSPKNPLGQDFFHTLSWILHGFSMAWWYHQDNIWEICLHETPSCLLHRSCNCSITRSSWCVGHALATTFMPLKRTPIPEIHKDRWSCGRKSWRRDSWGRVEVSLPTHTSKWPIQDIQSMVCQVWIYSHMYPYTSFVPGLVVRLQHIQNSSCVLIG